MEPITIDAVASVYEVETRESKEESDQTTISDAIGYPLDFEEYHRFVKSS